MILTTAAVKNYKSFLDSGVIKLTSGFNVIIGQNNAGKTALLEAPALRPEEKPHRSLTTHPTPSAVVTTRPTVDADIELTAAETLEREADYTNPDGFAVGATADRGVVLTAIHPVTRLHIVRGPDGAQGSIDGLQPPDSKARNFRIRRPDLQIESVHSGSNNSLASIIIPPVLSRIYLFKAERLNIGECEVGVNPELASNAANLPEVLNYLQSTNPVRYRVYNQLVQRVFPQIRYISLEPLPSARVRIRVWTVDPDTERLDLAPPLADSGTRVGQVLAILYVVLTAEHPRVIVIDEPQSFLHPGAVRKLFEVLREHSRHQFIVSTHSPVALSASDPETLLLVRQAHGASVVEAVDGPRSHQFRTLLSEIGVRLSDVFGADSVIWVEGKTEELCLPLILRQVGGRPLNGTVILGVLSTGEFAGRRSEKTVEIYQRLSAAGALLPPAIGFLFDREQRTQAVMDDLARRGGGRVKFLPRRMFESYLLDPEAISAVTATIEGFGMIDATEIQAWCDQHGRDRRFFAPAKTPATGDDASWIRDVAGATLLSALFRHFSEARVEYDKTRHGFELTKWLIENKPEALQELARLLIGLLSA